MVCKGRGYTQMDLFSGKRGNEIQCARMERLCRQNQSGLIFFRKSAGRLPEKQRVVRSVQLVAQQGVSQRKQSGSDLMKTACVRDAFHQTQHPIGGKKTKIGFGGLDLRGIPSRPFSVKFSFFRYSASRIGSEESMRLDPVGKHPMDHGQIGFPDPPLFEKRGQHLCRPWRLGKKDESRCFPVEAVDGMYLAESFPQKCQERIFEVAAGRVDGQVPRFPDSQEVGCFTFQCVRTVYRGFGQL